MAVVTRKRKGGKPTYYVTVDWNGKRYWERSGHEQREARRLNKQRLQELREGRFVPRQTSARVTVTAYAETWLAARKARWLDGESYLRRYVLTRDWIAGMRLEDVRKSHAQQLAGDLKMQVSEATGQLLSEKTCANIIGVLCTMFQSAVDKDILASNPFKLPRGTFQRAPSKRRTTYSVDAIRTLLASPEVGMSAKVFAALAFYTGMREGEICGRRWRDLDLNTKPLACLTVASQYEDRPLKTEKRAGTRPRFVPVHPELERVLRAWWADGWHLVHLREPQPDDFILPAKGAGAHTKSSAYKLWRKGCVAAGVANISLHSARHTFLSLCRRGGARKEVIERVTHNAAGDIVDSYTHWDWAPLCEAVACLVIGEPPAMELVTGVLTSVQPEAKALVEAPGIESGRTIVTTGNDSSSIGNDASSEPPGFSPNWPDDAPECAARQQDEARGLKVPEARGWDAFCPFCKCSLDRGCVGHRCVACMGHLGRYVRAVDVQQTSGDGADCRGVEPVRDRQTPNVTAEGAGSPVEPPFLCILGPTACGKPAIVGERDINCRGGVALYCAEHAPLFLRERPPVRWPWDPEPPKYDPQLLGACRAALAAIHGGRVA